MITTEYKDRLRQDGDWVLREVSSFLHGDHRLYRAVIKICEILESNGCHYALMDGIAMVLHGSCRVTSRIDILVDERNRDLLNRSLASNGYLCDKTIAGEFHDPLSEVPVRLWSSREFPLRAEATENRFGFRVLQLYALIEWKLARARARPRSYKHSSDIQSICQDLGLNPEIAERLTSDLRDDFLKLCEHQQAELIEL